MITVIGDLMIDRWIYGSVSRISPEAPVPVLNKENVVRTLGGAGNVANNIAALGHKVNLVSLIGNDNNCGIVKDNIRFDSRKKIIDKTLSIDGSKTIQKTRYIAQGHHMLRVDDEKLFSGNDELVIKHLSNILPKSKIVIISDYNKGMLTSNVIDFILDYCYTHKIKVLVDPKKKASYNGAFILTPNIKELKILSDTTLDLSEDSNVIFVGRELVVKYNTNMLITRSKDGMTYISNTGAYRHFKSEAKEVYDVSGAGDTVIATLAVCLYERMHFDDIMENVNKAAAIVVGKSGTSIVTREELGLRGVK